MHLNVWIVAWKLSFKVRCNPLHFIELAGSREFQQINPIGIGNDKLQELRQRGCHDSSLSLRCDVENRIAGGTLQKHAAGAFGGERQKGFRRLDGKPYRLARRTSEVKIERSRQGLCETVILCNVMCG